MVSSERRLPWYGWLGAAGLVSGEIGLALGLYPVLVLFYLIAWWSYVLLVDAWVWKLRGDSLVRGRRREFLVLAFWSTALWNLFEVFNLRLQNWFYVNVPAEFLYGAAMSVFAYATVLPAIFETSEWLAAVGFAGRARIRPRVAGPAARRALIGLGAAMLVAPLAWPRLAFPLIWGFAVLLLDPICHRWGARSLLGDLERGDPRPCLRLLAAGLICGVLWEFWNYWSHTKWIYTVPFFDEATWFEMPPLGFLGFPPFALECYVVMNLLNHFRRGRSWEAKPQGGEGAPRALAAAAAAAALVWNGAVYLAIDRFTVQSYSPDLRWVEGLPAAAVERLEGVGVTRPVEVLGRTATPEALRRLAAESGLGQEALREVRAAARLIDTRGLGARHYNTLRRLGIGTVEALAAQDPAALHVRWRAVAGPRAPTLPQVRIWVRGAAAAAGAPPAAPDQGKGRRGAPGSGGTSAAFRMRASMA